MATIASLLLELGADTKGLVAGVKSVDQHVSKLTKGFNFAKKAALGFGAFTVARGITNFVTNTARAADAVGKLSQRLGLSTDFIQEFRFAAELSGVAAGNVDTALQRVQRRLGEVARTGGGAAAGALRELGADLYEAARNGENFDTLLPKIADRLRDIEDETKRLSIAFKLFDKEGSALIQLLMKGSGAYKEFAKRAHEVGSVIDEELIKESEEFNDNLTEMVKNLEQLGRTMSGPVIKAFNDMTRAAKAGGLLFDETDILSRILNEGLKKQGQQKAGALRGGGDQGITTGPTLSQAGIETFDSDTQSEWELNFEDSWSRLIEAQKRFTEQSKELWVQWAAQAGSVMGQISLRAFDLFRTFSHGFGAAIADVIVYGEDLKLALERLFKNLEATVVQTVATMLIELAVARAITLVIENAVHKSRTAQAGQLIYLNAFAGASAIPVVGPFVAAGVAAAALKTAMAGGLAAGIASASMAIPGAAHGGFVTETGLVIVLAGELIGSPERIKQLAGGMVEQNISLFIDGRQVARSTVRHMPDVLNLHLGNT